MKTLDEHLRQPTAVELADFVRNEGAKMAARLLGVKPAAISQRIKRAGLAKKQRTTQTGTES